MKKLTAIILAVFMLCTFAVSAEEIPVYVDGEKLSFDVEPQMINDRVMVPMRFIFEKLGATVSYDDETRSISAIYTADEKNIIIMTQIDNPKAFISTGTDTLTIELDSPPVEIGGRTLVPVRFVSESLGCTVDWAENENAVYIKKNEASKPNPVEESKPTPTEEPVSTPSKDVPTVQPADDEMDDDIYPEEGDYIPEYIEDGINYDEVISEE